MFRKGGVMKDLVDMFALFKRQMLGFTTRNGLWKLRERRKRNSKFTNWATMGINDAYNKQGVKYDEEIHKKFMEITDTKKILEEHTKRIAKLEEDKDAK